MGSEDESPRNEIRIIDSQPAGIFGRLGGLGEAVVELIIDRDLRRSVQITSLYVASILSRLPSSLNLVI